MRGWSVGNGCVRSGAVPGRALPCILPAPVPAELLPAVSVCEGTLLPEKAQEEPEERRQQRGTFLSSLISPSSFFWLSDKKRTSLPTLSPGPGLPRLPVGVLAGHWSPSRGPCGGHRRSQVSHCDNRPLRNTWRRRHNCMASPGPGARLGRG